jgi:hypothetical protein
MILLKKNIHIILQCMNEKKMHSVVNASANAFSFRMFQYFMQDIVTRYCYICTHSKQTICIYNKFETTHTLLQNHSVVLQTFSISVAFHFIITCILLIKQITNMKCNINILYPPPPTLSDR